MSTTSNAAPTTVWIAIRHDGSDMDVQACATLEAAQHWLARVAISDEEWATYYHSLQRNGEADQIRPDRSQMSDVEILTTWAGDAKTYGDNTIYGESDFGMEILTSPVYARPQSA